MQFFGGEHDQQTRSKILSMQRMFNIVKYVACIIYSIKIRNNLITWCKSAHSIFQMKNTQRMLLSTSTSTTTAQCLRQKIDIALFNNQIRCFIFQRRIGSVNVSFRKPNIVNSLINQLDLNRPKPNIYCLMSTIRTLIS